MNINERVQRQLDELNKSSRHNEEMNLIRHQNLKLNDVANATLMLANEQINANKLQQQANEIIKLQCEELSTRNKILEEELKEAKKQQITALVINIVTILISIGSLITAILAISK